jgi:hypothetical protein
MKSFSAGCGIMRMAAQNVNNGCRQISIFRAQALLAGSKIIADSSGLSSKTW